MTRDPKCREELRIAGKPYPKSGCLVCGDGGLRGCGYERSYEVESPDRVHVPYLEKAAWNQMPKTSNYKTKRLMNYVGCDLYQWYATESVFEDAFGEPFRMKQLGNF